MIEKYKKLTTDLQGQKDELDEMEENEIQKIETMIKEEEEVELDADRVVDYLINLIAYLNEDDEKEDKSGKVPKKKDISVKNLLKNRFQKAGFNKEALQYRENRYADRGNQRTYSRAKNPNNTSNPSKPDTKKESKDNVSHTPKRSGFSTVEPERNPKSVDMEQNNIEKEKPRVQSPYHNMELDHRKLKIEDLEEETAEMIFKALDDVKEIKDTIVLEKSMLEETLKDLKSNFEKEKEVLNAKFESKKGHIQKYVENIQKDLEEELIRRNREKANFNLKLNNLDAKVGSLRNSFNNQDDVSENLAETVNLLVQTAMINQSMELQDEMDREKLALMGHKEEKTGFKGTTTMRRKDKTLENNNPYVALDKQCLTCSGQSSVVMKAFKIACLAYKPSPVAFPKSEGGTHTRIDLINLKGRMLRRLEEIPLTKSMRQEGANPHIERKQIFNMYLQGVDSKQSQKEFALNSLFNTRQPKITIRSETMSASDQAHPASPRDMAQKLSMNYEAEEFFKKNMTMLSDKTLALSRNPFQEKGAKKLKKRDSSSGQFGGSQTMSLPKIKTARNIDTGSINP